ncbi:MAG: hypothetical protein Devi2KO_09520 [Devosia indica]
MRGGQIEVEVGGDGSIVLRAGKTELQPALFGVETVEGAFCGTFISQEGDRKEWHKHYRGRGGQSG